VAGLIVVLPGCGHEREVAWAEGDFPLFDSPEVFFSVDFLVNPPHWFTVDFPPGAKEGDEVDVTGTIVRLPKLNRVWRLTGEVDDHHGYRGVWPD
jgi:hypothetical protein